MNQVTTTPIIQEVVNPETGEIIKAWVSDNPERYIQVDKESQKKTREYLLRKKEKSTFNEITGSFTFTKICSLQELISNQDFTSAEKTRIMFLGTYVSYNKSEPYLTFSNGRPILKSKLQELLTLTNRKEFYAFYNKLISKGIVKEDIVNRNTVKLIWSTELHFKGKTHSGSSASKNLFKTFDQQIRELYLMKNEKGKALYTASSLFNIFTLVPFIHPESNALCKYPDKPVHASEPFTLQDLKTLFKAKRTNDVKRMLLKIKLHDTPIVALSETSEGVNAFINPFLINRTGKIPNAALITMFLSSFNKLAEKNGWNKKKKADFIKGIIE